MEEFQYQHIKLKLGEVQSEQKKIIRLLEEKTQSQSNKDVLKEELIEDIMKQAYYFLIEKPFHYHSRFRQFLKTKLK